MRYFAGTRGQKGPKLWKRRGDNSRETKASNWPDGCKCAAGGRIVKEWW